MKNGTVAPPCVKFHVGIPSAVTWIFISIGCNVSQKTSRSEDEAFFIVMELMLE